MTYKFNIGDVVSVISQDRNISGLRVRIISRYSDGMSPNWYLVASEGIKVRLSFYETQLESA
jgi:hypothetical protein